MSAQRPVANVVALSVAAVASCVMVFALAAMPRGRVGRTPEPVRSVAAEQWVRIDGSDVNVRAEANASSTVLTRVQDGTRLPLADERDEWYLLNLASLGTNGSGWVHKRFAHLVNSAGGSPPDAVAGGEAPPFLVARGACPGEGCEFGQEWQALQDVTLFAAPPTAPRVSTDGLTVAGIIKKGTWGRTKTGLLLGIQHPGTLTRDVSELDGRRLSKPLTKGQRISIYSYLGEGCVNAWIENGSHTVCGADWGSQGFDDEWWVLVEAGSSGSGWTKSRDFVSRAGLSGDLGDVIADPAQTTATKLDAVDALLARGARFNDPPGRYTTDPLSAAIGRHDVFLLKALIARGLAPASPARRCPAYDLTQDALAPGAVDVMEFLLASGLDLQCLPAPRLAMFLARGIGERSYPVDRAVAVARVLGRYGVTPAERGPDGLNALESMSRNASLLEADGASVAGENLSALRQSLDGSSR